MLANNKSCSLAVNENIAQHVLGSVGGLALLGIVKQHLLPLEILLLGLPALILKRTYLKQIKKENQKQVYLSLTCYL